MKIAEVDKNFQIRNEKVTDGVRWYTIPHSSFALYGVFYDDKDGFYGCHPNDLGFYRMAQKIYKKMIEIDEIFRGGIKWKREKSMKN